MDSEEFYPILKLCGTHQLSRFIVGMVCLDELMAYLTVVVLPNVEVGQDYVCFLHFFVDFFWFLYF